MKIVFFGTSEFAVPALKKLRASRWEIASVVTQPDKPAGRKQEPLPSPIKKAAQELGLSIFEPEKLEIENWKLKIPEADLYIVASYSKIVPSEILRIPRFGALNIHPSLLPKYRGPSPIQTTILDREKETGVTIIKLDEGVDHGDIVASSKLKGQISKLKYKDVHDQLAALGAELLIETLPKYVSGKIKAKSQDHSKATFTKIITKDDGRIDWKKAAEEIAAQIRAFHIWPVAWTVLNGKRLKIFEALSSPSPTSERGPGEVTDTSDGAINVQTGDGILSIKELQLEGGKRLTAREFANGHPGLIGKILV
ncbi:MAG: methionyl-tRNA formyltransferase [bacterium]|nr:methionyl-tRNA formyltransferase [bacterium]